MRPSSRAPLNATLDIMAVPALRPHITGNAGLYYCCYRLSLLGWNVMPTSRNARGIDVLAYSSNASRKIAIQVKSLSKRAPVPLRLGIDDLLGDFWVIVSGVATEPKAYVLLPSEVQERAHRGEKDGRVSFWLQPREYALPQFEDAWHRIGNGLDS